MRCLTSFVSYEKRQIGTVVRPERIELPTSWFVAKHSIQLSYGRIVANLRLRIITEAEWFRPTPRPLTVSSFYNIPLKAIHDLRVGSKAARGVESDRSILTRNL